MDKYKFMECNSAGNCFFVDYTNLGDNYTINIYSDEECTALVDALSAVIHAKDEWDESTKKAYIEQEISDFVRKVIEYY